MSDSDEEGRGIRFFIALMVVGFVVGSFGLVAASHLANSTYCSGGIPVGTESGLYVTVDGTTQCNFQDPATSDDTVTLITEQGAAEFTAPGTASATVNAGDIEGTWTTVTSVDADANTIQIDPADKNQMTVGSELTQIEWRANMAADDGTVDFAYEGSTGNSRVTIHSTIAEGVRAAALDASSGAVLDVATADSGQITFDELDSGDHDVVIQSFDPQAPVLSNPAPTGGTPSPPTEVSVDVADGDFPRGDSVDVEIDVDGSTVSTQTITSNQTLTAPVPQSSQTGGSHDWSVTATDDYGETTSEEYSYSVPTELTFREEESGHDIIENGSADPIRVEATFFEDDAENPTIINRTTTDGTIDLDGLPVSSEFSVAVHAPGYHNRTVRLDSIFEQSSVFLISKEQNTVENRFVVSDRSGNFPSDETTILIQAPVNTTLYGGSGGVEWLSVSGDDLGADEAYVDNLIDEKRYRILVENEAGDQRNLGSYTAETTGTIQLTIGQVEIVPEQPNGTAVEAFWNNETGSPTVRVAYNDTARNTSAIHLNIYERNNESNVLVDNQTSTGSYGEFTHTEPVPDGESDTTWVVEVVGERSGGTVDYRTMVGPGAPVLGSLPAWVVTVLFVGMIWGVAGLFSQLNGHVGGLVVAGMGAMFYFVGLVPGYLGGGVVALALLTAGILFVREGRGGGL